MFQVNLSNRQIKHFNLEHLVNISVINQNGIYETHLNHMKTKSIDCSHNMLATNDGFSKFQNLYSLDLSHNKINCFFQLGSSLVELNLSHNKLGGVFLDFQKTLKSQGTRQFVGSFINNLKLLTILDLSYNEISVINSNIFENNTQLTHINLSNNKLNGPLWCLNKLEHLQNVDISHNQLAFNDIKPLEKVQIQYLELKFNPLENIEGINNKLYKLLVHSSVIHISFGKVEHIGSNVNTPNKNSNLDQSSDSSKGCQFITNGSITSRSNVSAISKYRNRTPTMCETFDKQDKSPIKVRPKVQQKDMTPKRKACVTPKKLDKSPSLVRLKQSTQDSRIIDITTVEKQKQIKNEQKSTVKIPTLPIGQMKVSPFELYDVSPTKILDDLVLYKSNEEEDESNQIQEEMRQLGMALRDKKQQQIQIERQSLILKNSINLMKLMIRGIYLYDVEITPKGFDEVMNELDIQLKELYPRLGDIKLRLMSFNENHQELGSIIQQVIASEKVIEDIKQLI